MLCDLALVGEMEEAPLEELLPPSTGPPPRPIKLFTIHKVGREGGRGLIVTLSWTSLLKVQLNEG